MSPRRGVDLRQVRAVVTDGAVLQLITPQATVAYLRRAGWRLTDREGVWTREIGGREVGVVAPTRQSYGDYAIRVGELLMDLAEVEGRSQLAILVELMEGEGGADRPHPHVELRRGDVVPSEACVVRHWLALLELTFRDDPRHQPPEITRTHSAWIVAGDEEQARELLAARVRDVEDLQRWDLRELGDVTADAAQVIALWEGF